MKAIIYSRVSSIGERQNTERQISELQKYAVANNIEVVKTYSEKISGATKNEYRDVLNECIEFAKNNKIDIILFSELSRLGRSPLEIWSMVKYLVDNKINAFFKKENLTLLDESGKMLPITPVFISCLGMVAEIERENIIYRLNSGRELAKEKGVKMGRKVGSKETQEDKKIKYPVTLSLIRKGYKLTDILTIAQSKGEKVSMSTIKRLKKSIN